MPTPKSKPVTAPDLSEISAIYEALEKRPLPRACQVSTRCCRFKLTGLVPMLTLGEALYAAKGVRASGRKEVKTSHDGSCPLLGSNGLCTIYQHRPFGCRTHFCAAAGGMYPRKHLADLIQRLEALDEKLGGEGARPLPAAVSDALQTKGHRRR